MKIAAIVVVRSMAIIASTMFLIGCAYNPPIYNSANSYNVNNKALVNMAYDEAWSKSLQTIVLEGFNIKTSQKQDGIITTDKKLIRLDETQADCGNIWGIPYTKDNRTTTNASVSLILQVQGGQTLLTVNSQIEGVFNATASSGTKTLSCYSLGYLEKTLIDKISLPIDKGIAARVTTPLLIS